MLSGRQSKTKTERVSGVLMQIDCHPLMFIQCLSGCYT